ncbi:MAG: MgtC/SapB family protein [Candidatus Thermoplasmatota archaeon]|nr:MgtC/SapB family protein [Candidatus Thermoplasmatota archaeon]
MLDGIDVSYFINQAEFVLRIFIAVILGAIIGYEREISHKPAGLRTHIFVCMGACLFTITSFYLIPEDIAGSADVTRIAAGVVAGISFIGAGSIIALRGDVKGLTTAASLWVIAAVGLMIGLGNYLLPIIAIIIAYVTLRLDRVEKEKINRKH